MKPSASVRVVNVTSLEQAINAQRTRLYQVSAILACLGNALHDVYAPGTAAPELQYVTDTLIPMLDRIASKLDPTLLKEEHMQFEYPVAVAVADGLREAATHCSAEQSALRTRLTEAARLIDQMSGRYVPPSERV